MTSQPLRRYHDMVAARSGAWRALLAGGFLCYIIGQPHPASASSASFEVNDQAIVQVIGRDAAISIETWNRNTVQVEWPDGEPFESASATQSTNASFLIPPVVVNESTGGGTQSVTLLPEDFPVPQLRPGKHDVVRIREVPPDGNATPRMQLRVTIPASTGLVNVRSGRGSIVLTGYHGTTIAALGRGQVVLRDVGGDAFVQPLNGRFYALDSNFDRLRVRSNRADEVFESCRVKQIEATTLTGNILFDDGTFDSGLARFVSDRGSIALGVSGGAQLGAHTQDGRVFSLLAPSAPPPFGGGENRLDGDALRFIGAGGPLVNAASTHGDIFLYDGSLGGRRGAALGAEWRPMSALLATSRSAERASAGGRRRL